MENDSSFAISNKKGVINKLTLLSKGKSLLNTQLNSKNIFITTILNIDPANDQLVLDYSQKDEVNEKITASASIRFRSEFQGVKVVFTVENLNLKDYQGQPAFYMAIPESIIWAQRRQFYRIKSPISKRTFCKFKTGTDEETMTLAIYDISLTGFSMLFDPTITSEVLTPSTQFKSCTLILDEEGEVIVSFRIRNVFPVNAERPDKAHRVGCEFTQITPLVESKIQRYMQQVGREIKQQEG